MSPQQDLDKTLKDGLGLRWSFMRPFETIELTRRTVSQTTAGATVRA